MRGLDFRETRLDIIVAVVRQLMEGRSIAAGSVELATGAGSTVVSNVVIPAACQPQLTPASAAAAAEVASVYISAVANGSFTISHPNNATVGRHWHWFAVGG